MNSTITSVTAIPAFTDNYIWCAHNTQSAIVVDPGDAAPVLKFLQQNNLRLVAILITHHHFDHTGGIQTLADNFPKLTVYGPSNSKIAGITHPLKENDTISIPEINMSFSILETPGHTLDHIVYFNNQLLFCGDTLFSAGCGRMFEGTPEVFYRSLQKLSALPSHTKVYCTHEYTQANIKFAEHIEPENTQLIEYAKWVNVARKQHRITLPSTIEKESAINPFLRCHIASLQEKVLNNTLNERNREIATFAALRGLKDNF